MRYIAPLALVLCTVHAAVSHAAVNVQPNPVTGLNYTQVLFNGASALRYDIVFIGDGFTESQQSDFNARVDDAVAALKATQPYARRMCAFNVWRVNVISSQAGVDHPADNVFHDTELDCRYGDPSAGEAERCITSDSPLKCFQAASNAPDRDAIFILVNDTQWGGCAGDAVFSSIAPGFAQIITHELGHKIGRLADEYECYVCNGSDDGRTYMGSEPPEANLTAISDPATTKWAARITTPPGVVGLWEGGGYFKKKIYRPQEHCQMRAASDPFCAVCEDAMDAALSTHCMPCEIHPATIECINTDLTNRIKVFWTEPVAIRRPIPPCLTCPPLDGPERVTLRVSGAPAGFSLRVLDDRGNMVAQDDSASDGLSVTFEADPGRQYVTDLTSAAPSAGRRLNLVTDITRNGKRQSLR